MNNKKQLGNAGEKIVEQWLLKTGFKILSRNFTCKAGEIDIIANKDNVIAFVEVKTRINEYFPTSLVITKTKQNKIIRTAQLFALKNNLFEHVLRFDVATVTFNVGKPEINYISNAFSI